MTRSTDDPAAIHIPGLDGRPICGTSGRTSAVALPTCPRCRQRTGLSGMTPEDTFNPAHPVGRLIMGSSFGLPGFPSVPGVHDRFRRKP